MDVHGMETVVTSLIVTSMLQPVWWASTLLVAWLAQGLQLAWTPRARQNAVRENRR